MEVTIKQTILINRQESKQSTSGKLKTYLCCVKRPDSPIEGQKKKRSESRVRFKEPNEVVPINCREPSWLSYRSWTSLELEGAIERYINDTLKEVAKSLQDEKTAEC